MRSRRRMSRSGSRKHFSRNAGVHSKNHAPNPMRGGFRL
ncbi:MAG: hypothetical protein [Microvirus sp.]|nr:MAG: hypothetical protein [Microvirus sp.]WNK14409.1 MAG: hypothetical protein [Microvirus sp.]